MMTSKQASCDLIVVVLFLVAIACDGAGNKGGDCAWWEWGGCWWAVKEKTKRTSKAEADEEADKGEHPCAQATCDPEARALLEKMGLVLKRWVTACAFCFFCFLSCLCPDSVCLSWLWGGVFLNYFFCLRRGVQQRHTRGSRHWRSQRRWSTTRNPWQGSRCMGNGTTCPETWLRTATQGPHTRFQAAKVCPYRACCLSCLSCCFSCCCCLH